MQTSDSIKEISTALVGFHKEVGKVGKDAANPFFKSKYASLSNILEAISEPLNKNGLSIVQFPEGTDGLTTRLVHSSGEWMEATYQMKPSKDDPQGRGSAITYQRRYAVGAILSLNIDDDDDGNAASKQPTKTAQPTAQPAKVQKKMLTDDAFGKAVARIGKGEKDLIEKLRTTYILNSAQEEKLRTFELTPA